MPGVLLGWGGFALEGHVAFDGFLRIRGDVGTSARSLSLFDLGLRYGFSGNRYVGPFVTAGGSFGLFSGKPRDRKLDGDTDTCAGFDKGRCSFSVNKNIGTRVGFGYGFRSSDDTTVAVRLDAMLWFFSVDDSQLASAPPAALVSKPQTDLAFLVGLEFMHWP